jgi:hypothetical protein
MPGRFERRHRAVAVAIDSPNEFGNVRQRRGRPTLPAQPRVDLLIDQHRKFGSHRFAGPARANSRHCDKDEREENMNQASHRSFSKW